MNIAGSRVLVTGGAGFIGSHLTEKLLGMGAQVTVYDRFDDFYQGKESNIAEASKMAGFRLVKGDILDRDALESSMKGMDLVFHMAGQAGVGFSVANPFQANAVNVDGTLNVLWLAKAQGVKRIVNASSSSVYGRPEHLPIGEEHPKNPTSPYAVSKLAAEQYCSVFHRNFGTDVVSLRYFSVYGPRGRPDQVVHRFTSSLVKREPLVIHGDGSNTRDFTHVFDIVSATILAGTTEGVGGEAFNIGFGARTSINLLAEKLASLMGMKGTVTPVHDAESKGDFPHTQADNRKAARLLGWEPSMSLDEGLKAYVGWFSEQEGLARAAA